MQSILFQESMYIFEVLLECARKNKKENIGIDGKSKTKMKICKYCSIHVWDAESNEFTTV